MKIFVSLLFFAVLIFTLSTILFNPTISFATELYSLLTQWGSEGVGNGQFNSPTKLDFIEKINQDGKSSKITKLQVGKATFAPTVKTTTSSIAFN